MGVPVDYLLGVCLLCETTIQRYLISQHQGREVSPTYSLLKRLLRVEKTMAVVLAALMEPSISLPNKRIPQINDPGAR